MSVATFWPTTNAAIGSDGTLTNPTNCYADDANFASCTTPGRNKSSSVYLSGFDFSSIPTGSVINSITIGVGWGASNTSSTSYALYAAAMDSNGGTALGSKTDSPCAAGSASAVTAETFSATATLAQLKASTFGIAVEFQQLGTNTAMNGWLDYASVTVNYTVTATGDMSATIPALTLVAAAVIAITGAATPTIPRLTLTGAAVVAVQGAATPTIPTLTLTGAGVVEESPAAIVYWVDLEVPAGTVAQQSASGSLNATIPSLTLSGTGAVAVQGTSSATIPTLTLTGTAVHTPLTGTATPTIPTLTLSGTGAVAVQGAATPTIPRLTLTGAAGVAIQGSATNTIPALTLTGQGGMTPVIGTATPTIPALTLTGAATAAIQGAATPTIPALTLSGTAVHTPLTGDASAAIPALTLTGAGGVAVQGSLNATIPALTLSGTGVVVQLLRPDADVSKTGWTGSVDPTNLYANVNESTPEDAGYVQGPDLAGSTIRFRLSDPSWQITAGDWILRYRIAKSQANGTMNVTVRLMEGASVRAARSHSDLGTTPTTYEATLSGAEVASISDPSALELEFEQAFV